MGQEQEFDIKNPQKQKNPHAFASEDCPCMMMGAYLSTLEPLNFGVVDVKLDEGMKVKEADFLWKTFSIPENDSV